MSSSTPPPLLPPSTSIQTQSAMSSSSSTTSITSTQQQTQEEKDQEKQASLNDGDRDQQSPMSSSSPPHDLPFISITTQEKKQATGAGASSSSPSQEKNQENHLPLSTAGASQSEIQQASLHPHSTDADGATASGIQQVSGDRPPAIQHEVSIVVPPQNQQLQEQEIQEEEKKQVTQEGEEQQAAGAGAGDQHEVLITEPPQNQQLIQPQNWKQKSKPYAIVVLIQFLFAGMNFITKLAMNNGMSNYVFVSYRNMPAFLILSPFAAYRERHRWSQIMTWSISWKILVLSVLVVIMDQDMYFLGMKYTTATLATALCNLLPGISFLLAVVTGETVNIHARPSQTKILGTVVSLLGAMVMTMVKGPILFGTVGARSHIHHGSILGVVFVLLSTLGSAFSNILQTIILDELKQTDENDTITSLPLTVASLTCLLGSIEALVVAVVMNRKVDYAVWTIFEWDVKVLSALYAGIFCSWLCFYLRGQVMQAKSPLFGTMFNPMGMILVAMAGYFFLDEQQVLGRVIGAIFICLGLYCVVWGTHKDAQLRQQENANAEANANVVAA